MCFAGFIGYAPRAFLFSATIAENIAFGAAADPRNDRATIERAAQAAGLTRDIAAFHDGYDTVVGERGITLSGGQRQRVALARALCADPRILPILDDSLSSVDAETGGILSHLRPNPGRAHVDPGLAPRGRGQGRGPNLVVDGGLIAERGTHNELLATGGVYAELCSSFAAEAAAAQEPAA